MRNRILVVLVLIGCKGKRDVTGDGFSLAEATQRHCQTFTGELARAANEYRTPRPDQSPPYGESPHERSQVGIQLGRQLSHCVFARNIERARLDEIQTRIALAQEGFGQATDLPASAAELDKLSAIAAEIDALPMRD
jgi:hypothetical protein